MRERQQAVDFRSTISPRLCHRYTPSPPSTNAREPVAFVHSPPCRRRNTISTAATRCARTRPARRRDTSPSCRCPSSCCQRRYRSAACPGSPNAGVLSDHTVDTEPAEPRSRRVVRGVVGGVRGRHRIAVHGRHSARRRAAFRTHDTCARCHRDHDPSLHGAMVPPARWRPQAT